MNKKEDRIVFPELGRTDEYKKWLERILESGNCPFCEKYWPGEHKNPYEIKKYWILTENAVKGLASQFHWLIICRRHVTRGDSLNQEEKLELFEIYDELIKKYDLEHLTLVMRSGNPATGSTVAHLHAQIFVSKLEEVNLTRI